MQGGDAFYAASRCTVAHNSLMRRSMPVRTVHGQRATLHAVTHDRDTCREFVVATPALKVQAWLACATVVYGLGYALHLHTEESWLLLLSLIVLTLMLLAKLYFKVRQESLLVVSSLGVQVTTTFALGRTRSTFYDLTSIRDIIINEAVTMHRVIHYMTLLLSNPEEASGGCSPPTALVPLFTHSWPSLDSLRLMRREISETLRLNKHD